MENKIEILLTIMIFVSFLGFIVENIWLSLTKGYIDNRNMKLPFLLGYGLFIIMLYLSLGTPDTLFISTTIPILENKIVKKICYFIFVFLLVSIGEIILGYITEQFFGFYYWNYEKLPLHITRYTSIPTSIIFTIIIKFFMQYCFNPLYNFISSFNNKFTLIVSVIVSLILFIDFITSFFKMHKTAKPNQIWKINIDKNIKKSNLHYHKI